MKKAIVENVDYPTYPVEFGKNAIGVGIKNLLTRLKHYEPYTILPPINDYDNSTLPKTASKPTFQIIDSEGVQIGNHSYESMVENRNGVFNKITRCQLFIEFESEIDHPKQAA